MSDDLKEVVQLLMSPEESHLVGWTLAHALAMYSSDLLGQMHAATQVTDLIRRMGAREFLEFSKRVVDLSIAAHNPNRGGSCTHCVCDDPQCCWCNQPKG